MRAKEMQIKYWQKELKDAERCIELYPEGSQLWDAAQKRYGYAVIKLQELQEECGGVLHSS